jgi:DNA-binding IclR family transcriptional regulator
MRKGAMTQLLQSVSQALRILRLLQSTDALGVTDVARALAIGSSTAHRLLATLAEQGFVHQLQSGGKYELGPAMRPSVESRLVAVATPRMIELRDRSSETVHIAVLRGIQTHFLAAEESPRIMRVTSRVGQTLPAHATAAGKLLLARWTDDELREFYATLGLRGGAAASIRSVDALLAEVALVRARGFGRNLAESEEGVAALAVPLRDADGIVVASLTVTGPDALFNAARSTEPSARELELVEMLHQTADLIHADLSAPASSRRKN